MGSWAALVVLVLKTVLELLRVAEVTRGRTETTEASIGRVFDEAARAVAKAQLARDDAARVARAGGVRTPDKWCRDCEPSDGTESGTSTVPGVATNHVEHT